MSEDPESLSQRVADLETTVHAMEDRLRFLEGRPLQDRSTQWARAQAAGEMAVEVLHPPTPETPRRVDHPVAAPTPPQPRRSAVALPRLSAELEIVIGTSWLNRLGIIAIIAAVAYFLKYSFDNQWIGPAGRVALTWILGLALLGAGERYQRRTLAVFGQGLTGGGIAVLYFAVYAAFGIYHIVGWALSFFMMILITAAAVVLALRHEAMAIAMLGLIAGFATPLLLSGGDGTSGGTGPQVASAGLYGYLLLLDAATYVVARRKRWWILGAVGLVAAFGVPVIVSQAGRPNPGAGLAYFLLMTVAVLALSLHYRLPQLGWAAVVGGFVVALLGGVTPVFTTVPYLDLAYFGIIAVASIFVADRLNWRGVANFAFGAGLVLGSAWVLESTHRALPIAALYLLVLNSVMLYASLRRHWRGSHLFALLVNALAATATFVYAAGAPAATRIIGVAAVFLLYNLMLALASTEETESRLLGVLLSSAIFAAQLAAIVGTAAISTDSLALAAVILAAYHVAVARALLRRVPELTVLLFLGLALTSVTVAVPLKLHGESVTLAWAAEIAGLAWAAGRTRNAWAGRATAVVAAATVVRLIGIETPRIEAAGLIATLPGLAFASGIAALGLAFRFLRNLSWPSAEERYIPHALGAISAALLLYWVGWEIDGVFSRGIASAATAGAKQVALSAWFTVYGVALLVGGIWKNLAPVRWAGIVLIGATILKVFFVDLVAVAVVFRILSLGILGALLLLASLAYSRSRGRLTAPRQADGGTAP